MRSTISDANASERTHKDLRKTNIMTTQFGLCVIFRLKSVRYVETFVLSLYKRTYKGESVPLFWSFLSVGSRSQSNATHVQLFKKLEPSEFRDVAE